MMNENRLEQEKLKEILDLIFKNLEKKGIRLSKEAKEKITTKIMKAQADKKINLTLTDVKNESIQCKLIAGITAFIMGKDKECDQLVESLNDKNKLNPTSTNKLLLELSLLKSLSKLLLDPTKKNNLDMKLTIDGFVKAIKDALTSKKNEKISGKEKEKSINELEKQLKDTLRNLNGGDNPNMNGEVNFPILGPIFGNLYALTNQTTPDPTSLSEMVESITFNAGKDDSQGLESIARLADLTNGISVDINEATQNNTSTNTPTYNSPNPFSEMKTGPHPTGTKTNN